MTQNGRTMDQRYRRLPALLVLAASALVIAPAQAALGGGGASVLADAGELGGTVNVTLLQQYDIHEITSASGMRVREFVDRAGVVFALCWSGPVVPDLQRLLGANFAAYARALAAQKRPGLQTSARVALPDLVVEVGGHLRAYTGRAYLPAQVPAGTSPADLR